MRENPSMERLADFLAFCVNTRGFSKATAETYAAAVQDLERTLGQADPTKLTAADLDLYMTRKALAGAATSTRRARAHAIRSFFGFLHSRGHLQANPAEFFRPPEEKSGGISTFTEEEVQRLIFFRPEPPRQGQREGALFFEHRAKIETLCAIRDSAMLGLCYVVGLRSGEIATLKVADLTYDDKGAAYVRLYGKAAREPFVAFVDRRVAELLEAFMIARQMAGIEHSALFCPIGPRGPRGASTLGLDQTRVSHILERRIREAGIQKKGRRLTPHVFRYTLATHLYEAGLPLPEIRATLRHRSVETTLRYIRLGSSKSIQKRANAKLPWNRPRIFTKAAEPVR